MDIKVQKMIFRRVFMIYMLKKEEIPFNKVK